MKDTKKIKNIVDWAIQIIAICAIIILLLNEGGAITLGDDLYVLIIAGVAVFCALYNFLYLYIHSTKKEDKKKWK